VPNFVANANFMYYKRLIDRYLDDWRQSNERKPLLIRGARQVGKSSAVRNLAKKFGQFVEINFEESPHLVAVFEPDLNPIRIIEQLSVAINQEIKPGKTLVFFDEIQACPNAISALRFFYEKTPNLHVIASGSLLEFALQDLSTFGVGRVRSYFLYPFSFDEFLWANGAELLYKAKQEASASAPLPDLLHQQITEQLKTFMLVGGMPEAVVQYVKHQSLLSVREALDDIVESMRIDFAKYKARVPAFRLNEVMNAVARQAGGKFVYARVSEQIKDAQAKEALELLILAGWVLPITHTAGNGLPMGAEADSRRRKMILLDTGIFQRVSGLDYSQIYHDSNLVFSYRGVLAEQFWALELIKYRHPNVRPELFYWHRESAKGNAEVDYLIQYKQDILPVEVKSNTKGAMQSLRVFLAEKQKSGGFRFSLEKHAQLADIEVWPLYAISTFAAQLNSN
jgi:uncharacterized protein